MNPARPRGRGRWRLWHFAAAVPVAALLLAAIRAIAKGPDGAVELGMVSLVLASACGVASLGLVRLGRKVAGRATKALKDWGVRRDGLVGLFAYLIGLGLEIGFLLVALVLGPVLVIGSVAWMAGLAGH